VKREEFPPFIVVATERSALEEDVKRADPGKKPHESGTTIALSRHTMDTASRK